MATLDSSIDPKQYFRMFWRRKGLVVLCAVVVACTAVIALEFIPEEYESSASLMIEDRQRLASQLESVMGGMRQSSGGYRADEQRMDSLVGRVHSQPFLQRVVRLLQMHEDPDVRARAEIAVGTRTDVTVDEMATRIVVGELRKKITFGRGGMGIYKIIVADQDPRNAQLLAKWISELFVDVSQQTSIDELKTAHEFGAQQLRIYEQELLRAERALEQYKEAQIEEDFDRSVVRDANSGLAEALYQRVLDEADLARLRVLPHARALSGTSLDGERRVLIADVQISNQARGLASSLQEALVERLVSDSRSVGDWPPAGNYMSFRRGLLQLIDRKVSTLYADAPLELREALARQVFSEIDHEAHATVAEFLGQAISDFRTRAQSEPRGELELARLQADVANNSELLRTFQSQMVASDVSQAMELTNLGLRIEILDPPQVPMAPARPNRLGILLAAFALGPVLGLAVAFASEILDNTLRSMSDFQRVFEGPVLGTTPLLTRTAQRPTGLRGNWIPLAISGILLVTLVFFLTRDSLLDGLITVSDPIQVVDPGDTVTP